MKTAYGLLQSDDRSYRGATYGTEKHNRGVVDNRNRNSQTRIIKSAARQRRKMQYGVPCKLPRAEKKLKAHWPVPSFKSKMLSADEC